jgi:hypothetical protein
MAGPEFGPIPAIHLTDFPQVGAGDSRPGLSDGGWRFGYGFPEFAIMPEKKFEHPQPQAARACRATPALPRGHGHAEVADVRAGSDRNSRRHRQGRYRPSPAVFSEIGALECDRGSANIQGFRRQTGRAHHPLNSAYAPGRSRPGCS